MIRQYLIRPYEYKSFLDFVYLSELLHFLMLDVTFEADGLERRVIDFHSLRVPRAELLNVYRGLLINLQFQNMVAALMLDGQTIRERQ